MKCPSSFHQLCFQSGSTTPGMGSRLDADLAGYLAPNDSVGHGCFVVCIALDGFDTGVCSISVPTDTQWTRAFPRYWIRFVSTTNASFVFFTLVFKNSIIHWYAHGYFDAFSYNTGLDLLVWPHLLSINTFDDNRHPATKQRNPHPRSRPHPMLQRLLRNRCHSYLLFFPNLG